MKPFTVPGAIIFFVVLFALAQAINSAFAPRPSYDPGAPAIFKESNPAPVSKPSTFEPAPIVQSTTIEPAARLPEMARPAEVVREPWVEYSTQAETIIATDIAELDESEFRQRYSLKCQSVSQSTRTFSGYGITTEMVVVTARFRLASSANSRDKLVKSYEVLETIEAPQFQGLNSGDTVSKVVNSLKEQMLKDAATVSLLRKAQHE